MLNRGDDTISVINSQNNSLDNHRPPPAGCFNQAGQQCFSHLEPSAFYLCRIDGSQCSFDSRTRIRGVQRDHATTGGGQLRRQHGVSVIDVSLDTYGNDSATFGTTFTIPVGGNPASVTALSDGSRAYTANQADGTVSEVNLVSHTPVKPRR